MIGPAVGADLDLMAAPVVAAIDQYVANAGGAHFAEGDFLRVGRHRRSADQATARIINGRRVATGRLSADDPASGIEGIVARAATISIFADLPRPRQNVARN